VEEWLPIFYLMVILKIPVAFLLYIVWWAFRAETEPEEAPETGGGEHRFGRFRRRPKPPRGPRRGPHAPDALPLPDCPPGGRIRILTPPAPARAAAAHAAQRGSAEPAES
jgi:hypothetical protein